MNESQLFAEVSEIVKSKIEAGQVVVQPWLVQHVIQSHSEIQGGDSDFYLLCAHGYLPHVVKNVLRHWKDDPAKQRERDAQMVLDGFERLQRAYLVRRDDDSVLVPINQLTYDEGMAKVREYERMAAGCKLHSEELRRYFAGRQSTVMVQFD